jgi:predicted nucleic acid-binding protein
VNYLSIPVYYPNCVSRSPKPVVDALLAVTAIVHNLTLVPRNDKDFTGFPVKVLNPWNRD